MGVDEMLFQPFTFSSSLWMGKAFKVLRLGLWKDYKFFRTLVGVSRVRNEGGSESDINSVLSEFTAWRKPLPLKG